MKCKFCKEKKYIERLNSKGVLEAYCTRCMEIAKQKTFGISFCSQDVTIKGGLNEAN
jgi:hypothetical protein